MRERLIELLSAKDCQIGRKITWDEAEEKELIASIADHLLANGVIVLPCKVGDTVYMPGKYTGQIVKAKVIAIGISEDDVWLHLSGGTVASCKQQLGKTVFLTQEEAEAALKERAQR